MPKRVVIAGGGAAGYFAAISLASSAHDLDVKILEGSSAPLGKVRISGGGRCNVTHEESDARALSAKYPRGSKELLGPFHRFGTQDTVTWFEARGVSLKTEGDGRIFPQSDQSSTVVDALTGAADELGVQLCTQQRVVDVSAPDDSRWLVKTRTEEFDANAVIVCTGSNAQVWRSLNALGLGIVDPVPSLFSFNSRDTRLARLSGLSVAKAKLRIDAPAFSAQGPLLITHWGLSGPAVLRLSAWGARELAACNYRFALRINWLGDATSSEVGDRLASARTKLARKKISNANPFDLPARLYLNLVGSAGIDPDSRWADLRRDETERLSEAICDSKLEINGKSTNKDEFVTAGGVVLSEIDFRRFAARRYPGLFLAGEVLDIDAITGGFNFQAAWTGGWLAGQALAVELAG